MKKHRLAAWILGAALLLTGCTAASEAAPVSSDAAEPESSAQAEPEAAYSDGEVIVYFANWYLGSKPAAEGAEVAGIPWDKVTYINHAFWKAAPAEGESETSWARRAAGKPARTDFVLASTDINADIIDPTPSALDPSMPRNHFAEYAVMSEKYPDVNIMISVGGWSDCGYFSEMAYTPEGRAAFIDSCMSLMDEYPWIDGIDLDWEYPGGSNDGERKPESDADEGCPIWGTAQEDRANFAALCKEMREAFDARYGAGAKKITACASASTGWTLPNQDWVSAEPYLDMINVMTYDMAGNWDGVTGHASGSNSVKGAFVYFTERNIPTSKFTVGSPLYATVFLMDEINPDKIVGAKIDKEFHVSGDTVTQKELAQFESEAVSGYTLKTQDGKVVKDADFDNGGVGWHFAYDEKNSGAYMYNDNPDSEYYKWYISYENALSLQAKMDLIAKYGMAGIIVWEVSEDTADYARVTEMYATLHP